MDYFSNEQLNKDFQNWWKDCYEEGDEPIGLFHEYMQYLYNSNIISRECFENSEYLDEYDFRNKL